MFILSFGAGFLTAILISLIVELSKGRDKDDRL